MAVDVNWTDCHRLFSMNGIAARYFLWKIPALGLSRPDCCTRVFCLPKWSKGFRVRLVNCKWCKARGYAVHLGIKRSDTRGNREVRNNNFFEFFLWSTITCDIILWFIYKLTRRQWHVLPLQQQNFSFLRFVAYHKYRPKFRNVFFGPLGISSFLFVRHVLQIHCFPSVCLSSRFSFEIYYVIVIEKTPLKWSTS